MSDPPRPPHLLDEAEHVVGPRAGRRGGEHEAEALLDEVGGGVLQRDAAGANNGEQQEPAGRDETTCLCHL